MRLPLAIVLLTLCAASPARAQTESADARALAREAFQSGERAFASDDYDLALRQFRRAHELAPNDVVRFNIAVCLERMGRFREAVEQYELAAASAQLDEAARARARAMAEENRGRLGTLVVRGEPAGAQVEIDGEAMCELPCEIELDPRAYRVVARTEGASAEATATVDRGGRAEILLRPRAIASRPDTPAPPSSDPAPAPPAREPTWLTWTGAAVAAIGLAGIIGFGAHAQGLHDAYVAMPDEQLRADGLLSRDLANASIAVAAAGALAIVVDLVLLAVGSSEAPVEATAGGARVRF